jgi:hypothetical protein
MSSILSRLRIAWILPAVLLTAGLGVTTGAARAYTVPPDLVPMSPCAGEQFSDVCPGDWFYQHVTDLFGLGAISGYADGTFRPNNTITRGQAMKLIVVSMGLIASMPNIPTFADVPGSQSFHTWVETGAANGVASGYACGGPGEACDSAMRPYFRPNANVNRGQLARMIVNAAGWQTYSPSSPSFSDVPVSSPYYGYVERATANGVLSGYACGAPGEPCAGLYFRSFNTSTRAQASKMVSVSLHRRTPTPTVTGTPPTATPTYTRTVTRTATRTPTRTNTPAASPTPMPTGTPGGPCPMFPANNIWNRNIAALPTHALSGSYVNSIGLNTAVHADFGSGQWNGGPIGIPFITVPGTQLLVPVTFTYWDESDPGPYPVPTNAPIEGGPNSTGDRHVLVVNRDACTLYEMYSSYPQSDGSWTAGSGARFQLTSNALRPDTWTSADAAGLPILPGLVTYDEVASGVIRHAVRFTASTTQRAYIWPARHYASNNTDPNQPPMGLRVRLKASVDISGYSPQVRVILQALKDYGMFLADNGSSWYISGAPDERWDNNALHTMGNLHGSDFEAVDESGLMIDPNSGQSR